MIVQRPRRERKGEQGFALLFIIMMAAFILVGLYVQAPRMAFEGQRAKEELLVQRGAQYVRAIQVYQRKMKKPPQTLDDLENTNQIRFLRRRFVDPFTGKDDWRLIHGSNGQLSDSLVKKPQQQTNAQTGQPGQPGTTGQPGQIAAGGFSPAPQPVPLPTGFIDPNQPAGNRTVINRRPDEMPGYNPNNPNATTAPDPNAPPNPNNPFGNNPAPNPNSPNYPQGYVPFPNTPYGQQPQQGQGYGTPGPATNPYGANQPFPGAVPVAGQPVRFPGYPTGAANSQTLPQPYNPNQPYPNPNTGYVQPPPIPNQQPLPTGANPALNMINQILTSPNPNGQQIANSLGATQPTQMGAGIVGIASKYDAEGIKLIDDRSNIKEWEFVYDPTKDKSGQKSSQPAQIGTPIGGNGQTNNPNNPNPNTGRGNSPFGSGFPQSKYSKSTLRSKASFQPRRYHRE